MVFCKFFLQGYCKFGENCRFQHYQDRQGSSVSDTNQIANYRTHNRSWQSPNYVHQQGTRANSPVNAFRSPQTGLPQLDPNDLATAIKEDVIALEEGGQWPLSCYTPLKDIGSFPGFHDTSMEEVRYEAYQALACGTFDQYVKKIGDLIQGTRLKWSILKNPSSQVMGVIEKMARGELAEPTSPSSSFSFNTFSFNSPPSPQASSSFSLGSNMAFAAPQASQQPQPLQRNLFPTPQVSTTSAVASNFRFALPQQSENIASPYSTAPPNFPPPPAFGATSGFGQSGGMIFGNNAAATPPSMNVGMQQPVVSGFFGNQMNAVKQPSIFGGASQTPATNQGTAFGSTASQSTFSQKPFQQSVPDLSVYTPLDHLTDSEKKEYSAVTFTIGCIPLRPPARELCS